MHASMKLGTQTGSLVNHVMSSSSQPQPAVGMGCTMLGWTDRRAGTIIDVSLTGATIRVQRDKATRTDNNGMSESQTYTFERDENAGVSVYTRRKNGRYVLKGDSIKGAWLQIGVRNEYYDFSF